MLNCHDYRRLQFPRAPHLTVRTLANKLNNFKTIQAGSGELPANTSLLRFELRRSSRNRDGRHGRTPEKVQCAFRPNYRITHEFGTERASSQSPVAVT